MLRIIYARPQNLGLFQKIIRGITKINDGIRCIKKPINFSVNGASPENASNAKSDRNKTKLMASTLETPANLFALLETFIFFTTAGKDLLAASWARSPCK